MWETALTMRKAIWFRAAEQANELPAHEPARHHAVRGATVAWQRALATARLALDDLSLVETHDCFTVAELIEYEAMGLTRGAGRPCRVEGWTEKDGRLPVNPSGGLKSKGHPIGATGVSMHALCSMQLMGEAGDMQVKDAKARGYLQHGRHAVANYVSILERLR